jgi:FXSXX-COOH protein
VPHEDGEKNVVYVSDVIDLSGIDLTTLNELSSPALRAAIARVRDELSGDGDQSAIYTDFRSTLRGRPTEARTGKDGNGAGTSAAR